jgi:hypothetical protein
MKQKVLSLIFAIGMIGMIITSPIPEAQVSLSEDYMPRFPSYDWSQEDDIALATVAANTEGSNREKQEAIISVLDSVWSEKNSIPEVVNIKYKNPKEPTEQDFHLVYQVIWGNWAED